MGKSSMPCGALRFLLVSSDQFPPTRVDVSILFGREMRNRGHTLDWILQSEAPCERAYKAKWSGCNVWVGRTDTGTKFSNRLRKHVLDLWNDLRMLRQARKVEYDVIQVKDKFISALIGIVTAKINNAKFIYWLSYPFPEASLYRAHDGTARYPWLYWLRGHVFKFVLYRMIIPAADHVFVQSAQMKRDIEENGISAVKLTPVPMGVALESFPYQGKTSRVEECNVEKRIVYLGTLTRVRRLDFLIRVHALVLETIPGTILYLVGKGDDPDDEALLQKDAERLGIQGRVVFTGFLSQQEAFRLVELADVCVSPFFPTPILNSTSPTKLVEYMAMGKPVVANDHPEQRAVIVESGAGICVPYEEKSFADAIIGILSHPRAALKMGARGRRYVEERRAYGKIADVVEKKYCDICGGG